MTTASRPSQIIQLRARPGTSSTVFSESLSTISFDKRPYSNQSAHLIEWLRKIFSIVV